MDDAAIVERIRNGEVNAYAVLIERYQEYVFSVVARHLPGNLVEEVAHEAFVKAYENLSKFRGECALRHWLARIAVNLCADRWRRRCKDPTGSCDALSPEGQAFIDAVLDHASRERYEEAVRQEEARALLDWALRRISPEDRIALEMTALDGRPLDEAAAILGWSVSKVKVRVHRARLKMRSELQAMLARGERHHER